jgi:hypothetical protein
MQIWKKFYYTYKVAFQAVSLSQKSKNSFDIMHG